MQYDYFLICPVRGVDSDGQKAQAEWVRDKEEGGKTVYWPPRDTPQNVDKVGTDICAKNRNAILDSRMIALWFSTESQGSLFDLGMAWMLGKPLEVVNIDEVELTEGKSFQNMVSQWSGRLIPWDFCGGGMVHITVEEYQRRREQERVEKVREAVAASQGPPHVGECTCDECNAWAAEKFGDGTE